MGFTSFMALEHFKLMTLADAGREAPECFFFFNAPYEGYQVPKQRSSGRETPKELENLQNETSLNLLERAQVAEKRVDLIVVLK